MSNEQDFTFGLEASRYRFPGKIYRPSSENGDSIIESTSRTFSSVLGQITEAAAVAEMRQRTELDPDIYQDFEHNYNKIFTTLLSNVRTVVMPEGKTLAHRAVLPHYLEVFDTQSDEIAKLTEYVDYVYNRSQRSVLEHITQPASTDIGNEIKKWERKYFLDTLLILSRLALKGVGENFNNFGQLMADVPLRDTENVEVTQLDAVFVSKKVKFSGSETAEEREQLFRSIARKCTSSYDHPFIPPIANKFVLLEAKTLYRARWSIGNLPQEIPPFLMQEITERIGKACVNAHIGLVPRAIIYLRMRSLAPNTIHIIYPDRFFYSKWQDAVNKRLDILGEPSVNDEESEKQQRNLLTMFHFLGSVIQNFEEKEKARHIKRINIKNNELNQIAKQLSWEKPKKTINKT